MGSKIGSKEFRGLSSLVGLFVSIALMPILNFTIRLLFVLSENMWIMYLLSIEWVLTITVIIIVLKWERFSLTSIGIKTPSGRDVIWGVAGFFVGILSFILTSSLMMGLGFNTTASGIRWMSAIPLSIRLVIVFTAGIAEEILYRGYPIERLLTYTRSLGLSVVIPYVFFVILHIPLWGIGGSIQIGVWTLIITYVYVKRRNLYSCILMHILNDIYAFIVLPATV